MRSIQRSLLPLSVAGMLVLVIGATAPSPYASADTGETAASDSTITTYSGWGTDSDLLLTRQLGTLTQGQTTSAANRVYTENGLTRMPTAGPPDPEQAGAGGAPQFYSSLPARPNDRVGTEPATQRTGETEDVTAAAAPAAASASFYNRHSVQSCIDEPRSLQPGGHIRNHFSWCEKWTGVTQETLNNIVVGTLVFQVVVLADGYSEFRRTDLYANVSSIQATGTLVGSTLAMKTTAASDNCQVALKGAGRTVAQWLADPDIPLRITNAVSTGVGIDRVSACNFRPYGEVRTPRGITNLAYPAGNGNGFRCDSATYINQGLTRRPDGCIFDRVTPVFQSMSRTDPRHGVAATHIYDALNSPATTYPTLAGKITPGKVGSGRYTTRLYHDTARRTANRNAAVAACLRLDPNYARRGLTCDEFPFATTREGAAVGDNRFSVRIMTRSQNASGGGVWSDWLYRDRILDGDGLYIIVN